MYSKMKVIAPGLYMYITYIVTVLKSIFRTKRVVSLENFSNMIMNVCVISHLSEFVSIRDISFS